MNVADLPKFVVRLPVEMKEFIEAEAARNGCSQNSEIVRSIRERMDRIAQVTVRRAARQTA